MSTLTVDDHGTELAYIDSGVPVAAAEFYTTIFAIHGLTFTGHVFKRIMALAPAHNLRIVAISRRDYPGSTPLSPTDLAVVDNGTEIERAAYLHARGVEIATFIDRFIQRNPLPPISSDGKCGGIALLGWSFGNFFSISCVAAVDSLPIEVSRRLKTYLRTLILLEPPSVALGTPLPPAYWTPRFDTNMPPGNQVRATTHWITGYYQHGDLSTRDPSILSYVVPETFKVPSIFNMSQEEIPDLVYEAPATGSDTACMLNFFPQAHAQYRKAVFDNRQAWPAMGVCFVYGTLSGWFSFPSLWEVEKDNELRGGNFVDFKVMEGANHFMHWDDPQKTIEVLLEGIDQSRPVLS